jgi:capsular exopolysaccharide synthesis family protein
MAVNNNNQFASITLPVSSQAQTVDFAKLLKRYLFHWPIFFLSLAVFFVSAYFYLQYAKPVYPIAATIQFKNVKTQDYSSPQNNLQGQLDPLSKPIIFENEIEIMKSKKIMLQVVDQLKLWINYSKKDGMVVTDLYKSSPVVFQFLKPPPKISDKGINLDIIIKDGNSFIIKEKDDKQTELKFGQPIQSNFGLWKLDRNSLTDNFYGNNIQIGVSDPSNVADGYVSGIKSSLDSKDVPFVELSTSDPVPARGIDVLNTVLNTYLKTTINEKNKKTESTIKFISKRIDSIGKDLHSDEAQLENYASSQGLTDINSQSQSYVQDAQSNQKALNDINIQIRIINAIDSYINSPANNDRQPSTQGLQDAGLNAMLDQLSQLQLQKTQLLAKNPPDNPVFEPINNQINNLQEKIKEKVRTNKEALLLTKNQLESYGSRSEGLIKNVPSQQMHYNGIKRDNDVESNLYSYLLQQREQLSLKFASTVSDAEVVDYAHAGSAKWPKPGLIYILAGFIGLFIPVGIIYTRDSFDDKITTRQQIEDAIDVPVLGELSYQESSTQIVITKERGNFAIGEQFRALRAKLYQVLNENTNGADDDLGKVTLITSSTSGEGKSFISANIAVTLAYAAKKTIILEMDLRKPKTSVIFDLSPEHTGISDYLDGDNVKIDSLIQPSGIPNLDVLGCGSILNNPSELLEKNLLEKLITHLRGKYDQIIIDTPPIHLVTDAIIIARVVDASLYVIRQGYTLKEEFKFINDVNADNRLPKLNIIFNGIKREKYGYGYNYNNSYYNTYTSRPKNTVGNAMKSFFNRF